MLATAIARTRFALICGSLSSPDWKNFLRMRIGPPLAPLREFRFNDQLIVLEWSRSRIFTIPTNADGSLVVDGSKMERILPSTTNVAADIKSHQSGRRRTPSRSTPCAHACPVVPSGSVGIFTS